MSIEPIIRAELKKYGEKTMFDGLSRLTLRRLVISLANGLKAEDLDFDEVTFIKSCGVKLSDLHCCSGVPKP